MNDGNVLMVVERVVFMVIGSGDQKDPETLGLLQCPLVISYASSQGIKHSVINHVSAFCLIHELILLLHKNGCRYCCSL